MDGTCLFELSNKTAHELSLETYRHPSQSIHLFDRHPSIKDSFIKQQARSIQLLFKNPSSAFSSSVSRFGRRGTAGSRSTLLSDRRGSSFVLRVGRERHSLYSPAIVHSIA